VRSTDYFRDKHGKPIKQRKRTIAHLGSLQPRPADELEQEDVTRFLRRATSQIETLELSPRDSEELTRSMIEACPEETLRRALIRAARGAGGGSSRAARRRD
jgi:hypothetical protein